MTRSRRSRGTNPQQAQGITALWLLRILVPFGGQDDLLGRTSFSKDSIVQAVGLGDWIDNDDRDFDATAIRSQLRDMHRKAEAGVDGIMPPPTLIAHMERLANLGGLSATDCRILEFSAMMHHDRVLDDGADTLGQLCSVNVMDTLARLLDLDPADVRSALSPHGLLARSGLLAMDCTGSGHLRSKLDLLSEKFADYILACETDPLSLLRDTVRPSLNFA